MNQTALFQIICEQIRSIIPELMSTSITPAHSLKALGANSLDRAEIITLTLSVLKLKIPLIEFAKAENIQQITDIFYRHASQENFIS